MKKILMSNIQLLNIYIINKLSNYYPSIIILDLYDFFSYMFHAYAYFDLNNFMLCSVYTN